MPRFGDPTYEYLHADETPSEAQGTYGRKQFYFYARWKGWEFAMNDIGTTEPFVVLDVHRTMPERRCEHFSAAVVRDYERSFVAVEDAYGEGELAASYMPETEIRRLINRCIDLFEAGVGEA